MRRETFDNKALDISKEFSIKVKEMQKLGLSISYNGRLEKTNDAEPPKPLNYVEKVLRGVVKKPNRRSFYSLFFGANDESKKNITQFTETERIIEQNGLSERNGEKAEKLAFIVLNDFLKNKDAVVVRASVEDDARKGDDLVFYKVIKNDKRQVLKYIPLATIDVTCNRSEEYLDVKVRKIDDKNKGRKESWLRVNLHTSENSSITSGPSIDDKDDIPSFLLQIEAKSLFDGEALNRLKIYQSFVKSLIKQSEELMILAAVDDNIKEKARMLINVLSGKKRK